METKYNVGDKVLISAKVVEITVTDEKIEYLLKYKDNGSHATYYSKQLEDDIRGIDPTPDEEEEDAPVIPDDPTPDEPVTPDDPTPGDDTNPDDTGSTDDTGSDSTTTTDGNEQNNG